MMSNLVSFYSLKLLLRVGLPDGIAGVGFFTGI